MTAGVRASVRGPAPQGRSGSGPDKDFRASRAGHDPVSVGHLVEADGAVEDPARLGLPSSTSGRSPSMWAWAGADAGAAERRRGRAASYPPAGLQWSPSRPVPTAARAALPGCAPRAAADDGSTAETRS